MQLQNKLSRGQGLGCHWSVDLRHISVPVLSQELDFQRHLSCFFFYPMIWGERWLIIFWILVELWNIILNLITYSSLIVKTYHTLAIQPQFQLNFSSSNEDTSNKVFTWSTGKVRHNTEFESNQIFDHVFSYINWV